MCGIAGILSPDKTLWHYVSLRFISDVCMLFKGVRKLPAATTHGSVRR